MRIWKSDTTITLDQCRKFLKYYGENNPYSERPLHEGPLSSKSAILEFITTLQTYKCHFCAFVKYADIMSFKTWCFSLFCSLQYVLFLVLEKGRKEKSKEILHKEMELRRSQNLGHAKSLKLQTLPFRRVKCFIQSMFSCWLSEICELLLYF